MEKTDILHSLRRVEGQLRGIQKMVDEGRPCDDILAQLVAAHAAIGRIGTDVLLNEVGCHTQPERAPELELERLEKLLVTYGGLK
ncbi:MAG TPA: metal-sensitive transcriptional regulator [Clostridia bacterium]|nr:metal-sensitive transcriptional regulator [Clostridia bacterium]